MNKKLEDYLISVNELEGFVFGSRLGFNIDETVNAKREELRKMIPGIVGFKKSKEFLDTAMRWYRIGMIDGIKKYIKTKDIDAL